MLTVSVLPVDTVVRLARASTLHRYARVESPDVHADYRLTGIAPRLGHALQRIAGTDGNSAAMAEAILRTGDHSALPVLADALDEEQHPLREQFDYRHAARAVEMDKALHGEIGRHRVRNFDGEARYRPLSPGYLVSSWTTGTRSPLSKKAALTAVRKVAPDATHPEVYQSLLRLFDRQHLVDSAESVVRGEGDWYPLELEPRDHTKALRRHNLSLMHSASSGKQLTDHEAAFYKYPDIRAKKKFSRAHFARVVKYGRWRSGTLPLPRQQRYPDSNLWDDDRQSVPNRVFDRPRPTGADQHEYRPGLQPPRETLQSLVRTRNLRHRLNRSLGQTNYAVSGEVLGGLQSKNGLSVRVLQSASSGNHYFLLGHHDADGNLKHYGVFGAKEIEEHAKAHPELKRQVLALKPKWQGKKVVGVAKYARDPGKPHKFSSVLVPIEGQVADTLKSMAAQIEDGDLTDDGRETDFHVTALYGLHGTDPDEIQRLTEGVGPVEMKFGCVSIFSGAEKGKDYDVVKVDVISPDLHRLHAQLSSLPNSNPYPEYKPHVTLAYVKKGLGRHYADTIGYPRTWGAVANHVVFSSRTREQTVIPLSQDPSKYARLRERSEWGPIADAAYEHQPGRNNKPHEYPVNNYRDHLGVLSDYLQDEGDFRHHIVTQHATAEKAWIGPYEIGEKMLDGSPLPVAHHLFSLTDGSRLLAQVRQSPNGKKHGIWLRWIGDQHHRPSDVYESYWTPEQGRAIVDEMPDSLREQVHSFLDQHLPGDTPSKYAAYKAPAGGIVVRGTYYKGGSLIPDLQKYEKTEGKRHRLQRALRKRKGQGTQSVVTTDADGDGESGT